MENQENKKRRNKVILIIAVVTILLELIAIAMWGRILYDNHITKVKANKDILPEITQITVRPNGK